MLHVYKRIKNIHILDTLNSICDSPTLVNYKLNVGALLLISGVAWPKLKKGGQINDSKSNSMVKHFA